VIGGPSTTGDISEKSAFKCGNPTHRAGAFRNTFRANRVAGYTGSVFYCLPTSAENVFAGNECTDTTLCIHIEKISGDTALVTTGNVIRGNTFTRPGQVLRIDGYGGSQLCVRETIFEENTIIEPPGTAILFDVDYASDLAIRSTQVHRALNGATNFVFDIRSSSDVVVSDVFLHGGKRGFYVASCPAIAVEGLVFKGLGDSIVLQDAGGNTGGKFYDYEALGFAPVFTISSESPFAFQPRRQREMATISYLSLPEAFTGSGNLIPFDTSTPLATEGNLVMAGTIQPLIPRGKIVFHAVIPYVSISADDNIVATAFWDTGSTKSICGVMAARLTAGATSGQGLELMGWFDHALTDLSTSINVTIRIGCKNTAPTVTVGTQFGNSSRPYLLLRESAGITEIVTE
jgi:hypothetical protein